MYRNKWRWVCWHTKPIHSMLCEIYREHNVKKHWNEITAIGFGRSWFIIPTIVVALCYRFGWSLGWLKEWNEGKNTAKFRTQYAIYKTIKNSFEIYATNFLLTTSSSHSSAISEKEVDLLMLNELQWWKKIKFQNTSNQNDFQLQRRQDILFEIYEKVEGNYSQ